ncbi:MAG: hypothetical protein RMJ54_17105 [Roseiflexaceae bacterium]|nr:hypothetical protein [Roseiflexaceae bacterium]
MKDVDGGIEGIVIANGTLQDVFDGLGRRISGRTMDTNVIARRGLRLVGRGQEGVEGFFHIPPAFCVTAYYNVHTVR